jgi:hypothetical protein
MLLREIQEIKCPAVAFAFKAKAPEYLGFAKNIVDTAGHFIIAKGLIKTESAPYRRLMK